MFSKGNLYFADWRDKKGVRHRKSFKSAEAAQTYEAAPKAALRGKSKVGMASQLRPLSRTMSSRHTGGTHICWSARHLIALAGELHPCDITEKTVRIINGKIEETGSGFTKKNRAGALRRTLRLLHKNHGDADLEAAVIHPTNPQPCNFVAIDEDRTVKPHKHTGRFRPNRAFVCGLFADLISAEYSFAELCGGE